MLVKIDTKAVELQNCGLIKVGDRTAICDLDDIHRIAPYKWFLRTTRYNTYAFRKKTHNDKTFNVYMHRQIMHCPTNLVVHHKNHNGLDNRKENLQNMSKEEHYSLHRFQ